MQLLRATALLFAAHLGRSLRSRRTLVCLGIVLLPVAAAAFISWLATQVGEPPENIALRIGWTMHVQAVMPLVAVLLGSAVVAEEVDDRTITYLVTRPIPRPAILLGRWLATQVVLLGLLSLSAAAVFALLLGSASDDPGRLIPAGTFPRLLEVILAGGLVYSAVFAALGAWVRHPVIVGLGYAFAVEVLLANLPGSNQKLTIQYYLRSLLAGDRRSIREHLSLLRTEELVPPLEALQTLGWILVVALALGAWILSRRQYVVPS